MTAEVAQSDVARAMALYSLIGTPDRHDGERMVVVTVPGSPISKARPRFAKGVTYHDKKAAAAERRTAHFIGEVIQGRKFTGNVALGCIFFRPNLQRIDVDNLLKHVCDAANGVAWVDDSQVTAAVAIAECDPQNPRTVIVFGHHASTLIRGTDAVAQCVGCGAEYSLIGVDRRDKRYCTYRCAIAHRTTSLAEPVPCPICSTPFRRTTSAQQTCSNTCRVEQMRGRRRSAAANLSSCSECGKTLSHRRGGRCRDCWRAAPRTHALRPGSRS